MNTLKKDWKSDLGIKHVLLTIKCLLIVPNPESALNEEAGKMLLEHYDDYSQRAKLMTDIHARSSCSTKTEHSDDEDGCSSSKKLASEKKVQDKKKEKLIKEKRKILKRLWGVAVSVNHILYFLGVTKAMLALSVLIHFLQSLISFNLTIKYLKIFFAFDKR